jgi:hypothetical protein
MGGQPVDHSLNVRAGEESDAKEGTEDGEIDDENVEEWELEDDESDYNDSGYYDNIHGSTAGTHHGLFSGVSGDSATSTFDQFLELLFQLCTYDAQYRNFS